ncbi:beta-galactosidase [Actinoalloteichus hoggarensis]|uniref:Beta-galactosidase n=1 Tax=Actinoalloteichus hoggarensis TaxID=1470176 RepID=A0A221VZW2_9PSEU|nr:beta-galactosidase [Actinoalloteichus hoggarensis]ASO19060.1 Beta-galactosidase bgaB [Actinoalloteichus hoggarensis]MBB5920296.1 beta-galactosidase [Actinoalloteichus hoggarensis]
MAGISAVTRGRIVFGGDYNPEQWPSEVWREDVELMRRAGVSLVTVGVFSWSRLEPTPGARDFGWLDEVLDLLHAGGIAVDLATPTASPPPWLGRRHPETLPVDADGRRLVYGSRNHFCPSSPVYRRHALSLVADLAQRYGDHPALAMWHVDNELCEVCHCDVSAAHFRHWLRSRYDDDLDALNEAWHTVFWSQRYSDWAEILPPRRAPYLVNPGQRLDFRRFCSAALLECFQAQRDVLRAATPDIPITTNFLGLDAPLDYRALAEREDVVSHDWYPDPTDPAAHELAGLSFDVMRSLAGGPWMVMEGATSAVNWRRRNGVKAPGRMRAESLHAVARGADAVCFFQWRASRAGAEKYHSAMVPHAGPDTRIFREVCELGVDLTRLAEVVGADVESQAALVLDWESWWAVGLDAHPTADVDVLGRLRAWHAALARLGVTADVVASDADFSGRRLVIVPNLYLVTDDAAANLTSFVRRGGTLVLGCFSGIVDEHDHIRLGGYPAPFRELLGLRIEEFDPLDDGESVRCSSALLGDFEARDWLDDLRVEGAEVVAEVAEGRRKGRPVVLRHGFGAGTAWYVATEPEPAAVGALARQVCAGAGVTGVLTGLPAGVTATRRGRVLFVINHGPDPASVELPAAGVDLLRGGRQAGRTELPGFGVLALVAE